MSASSPKLRYRYEDYRSLVESTDRRYELMDGDIFMVPSPSASHQRASRNLQYLLLTHVRYRRSGEVLSAPFDVELGVGSEREVVQPDLIYVGNARRTIVTERAIAGAPDLVVEILSPATADRDRGYKKALYARSGVAEYWIVDPVTEAIEVLVASGGAFILHRRYAGSERLSSPLFPDLEAPLEEIFGAA